MSQSKKVAFEAISNFTSCLAEIFGEKQKSLALYDRLLKRTTIDHSDAVDRHFTAFKSFCIVNKKHIIDQDTNFEISSIVYSPRVYIDLKPIFSWADADTASTIWSHLVSILALVDTSMASKCKETLARLSENVNVENATPESDDFLSNLMSKVEKHVNPDASPQEAMASIFSSGMIGEIMSSFTSGMQNGQMDITKLMGSVQKMMGNIATTDGGGDTTGDAPGGMPDMMGMVSNMMGMMGGLGGAGGGINPAEMLKELQGKK